MSRLSEKLASMTPRTRQYIMLGGAGTVFLGLVAGSVALWDSQPAVLPTPTNQQQPTNISAPGSSVDPKDVWMTQSAAQMKQMDDVIKGAKAISRITSRYTATINSAAASANAYSSTIATIVWIDATNRQA